MIKDAGDWTKKFIELMYSTKQRLNVIGDKEPYEFLFDDLEDSKYGQINTGVYFPKVYVSKPVSAPAEQANYKKNQVYVGTGSGIAPFFAILEEHRIVAESLKSNKNSILVHSFAPNFNHAHMCLICRDPE